MNEKTCESCVHFRRHYMNCGRRCHAVDDGHCGTPMLRRLAVDQACSRYEEAPSPTASF